MFTAIWSTKKNGSKLFVVQRYRVTAIWKKKKVDQYYLKVEKTGSQLFGA